LAYFNVTEELRLKETPNARRTSYEGLPVTNVAIALPIFYMVATMFRDASAVNATNPFGFSDVAFIIMSCAYLLIAFLFVFRFKMPKLRVKGLVITMSIVVLLVMLLLAIQKFVLDFEPVWFLWM
jgi:phosphatidylserine synthase